MHWSMTRTHNMAFTQHHVRRRNLRAAAFAKGDGARVVRGKCYVTKDVSAVLSLKPPLPPPGNAVPAPFIYSPRSWSVTSS